MRAELAIPHTDPVLGRKRCGEQARIETVHGETDNAEPFAVTVEQGQLVYPGNRRDPGTPDQTTPSRSLTSFVAPPPAR